MYILKRCIEIKTLRRFLSFTTKNHYETLRLRKDCTEKDIKQAFINLSKEYHPDKNKDAKAQEQFVEILEAYNVLSKPNSRAEYDSSFGYGNTTRVTYERKPPEYNYYAKQTKTNRTTVKSVKFPNHAIIGLCAGVTIIGVLLQVFVIRNMYKAHREQCLAKSKLLAEELDRVRARADANGNALQTRLLLDKIVTAANPTIATASLGQTLANDKNGALKTNKMKYDFSLLDFDLSEEIDEVSTNEKDIEPWSVVESVSTFVYNVFKRFC